MFTNYLKTAIRNLWKNKTFSLINIGGLAIGMSVSFLILLYILNEVTYDRFNENHANIYRIATKIDAQGRHLEVPSVPAPLGPALVAQFPEVIRAARLQEKGKGIISYEDKLFEESRIYHADPDLFHVFTIPVVRGNPETWLEAPFSMVVTEEIAQKKQVLPFMDIDADFLDTMGMELAAGRNFSPDRPSDKKALILNETLAKQLGWDNPLGKIVSMTDVEETSASGPLFIEVPYTVVGVVRDFHFESLHQKIRGHLMKMSGNVNRISVKLRTGNISETLRSIETIWRELEPAYPFRYTFLDESFDRLYRSEQRMGQIFISFTSIAILISCLGLFGLASFTAEQRTKEIGIRKVLGASVSNILLLLSREFTKWVLLANIIAWPIAYYAMWKWLQGFAYRIDLEFWIFLLSGIMALFIALLTVVSKSLRTAITNPVNALRYE
jgi:hypothetical protein